MFSFLIRVLRILRGLHVISTVDLHVMFRGKRTTLHKYSPDIQILIQGHSMILIQNHSIHASSHLCLKMKPCWLPLEKYSQSSPITCVAQHPFSYLLPLTLKPCCFKYSLCCLLVRVLTAFSSVQDIPGSAFLCSALFFAFVSRDLRWQTYLLLVFSSTLYCELTSCIFVLLIEGNSPCTNNFCT